MFRKFPLGMLVLTICAALSAGAVLAQQRAISIATGGTGGVYYPLGGGLANILSKTLPGIQATAEVTGGSVDNLKLIGAGKSELAFVQVDAALDAYNGEDKFKGNKVPVRALMILYPNRMHVVSVEGAGIEKMSDLKGKRVSTGSPGSATEVFAFRVIEAAGLDKDKDMKRERLSVAESTNSLKDRKIDAYFWEDKFKGNKVPVRTLMILYPNRMHVVSVEGAGIEKMSDLKGKRVSTGSPGSATEVFAFRVIEAAGLDKDKDMKRERLSVAESTNSLKDRKIDAYFWVGGLPTAAVTDLAATPGMKIKLIDHADVVEAMNKKYGNNYTAGVINKGVYPGQDKDNKIAVVWNILVANANMPDQEAYDIVKTVFDKKADLVAVHKEAENFVMENQKKENSPIPFHPGAAKYFAERGAKVM